MWTHPWHEEAFKLLTTIWQHVIMFFGSLVLYCKEETESLHDGLFSSDVYRLTQEPARVARELELEVYYYYNCLIYV